jgi:hypothetical protein
MEQPRRASRIVVLHSDTESGIFCLGRMATKMMMMVSYLRVVVWQKKGKECANEVKRAETPMETPMRKSITSKSRPIAFSEFGWILPNNAMLQSMLSRVAKNVNFETRNLIKVTSQTRKAMDDDRKITPRNPYVTEGNYSSQSLCYGGWDSVLV